MSNSPPTLFGWPQVCPLAPPERQEAQQTLRFATSRAAPHRLSPQDAGGFRRNVWDVVGALVLDRFRLEERIGGGGSGDLYRAWDPRLERHVAVKVVDAAGEDRGRVLRDAQAAARLNHPAIAVLYELGSERGHAYLVGELVRGSTLENLAGEGDLSDRDVAEIGADLCRALTHAHSRGVPHGDIKPRNVMVCDTKPRAKLLDFGVARLRDGPAEAPADVFSLGLMLYECWAGARPQRQGTPGTPARPSRSRPPSICRLRPDLPEALTSSVDACLDTDPRRRPTPAELGARIDETLDSLEDTPRRRAARHSVAAQLASCEASDIVTAATIAGLSAAAVLAPTGASSGWGLALAPLAGLTALLRPRLGYLLAVLGLAAWFAIALGRPGAALVIAVATLPPVLLARTSGRMLTAPAAAPLMGVAGFAAAFPLVAALAPSRRDRATLAVTGCLWLALAEVALGRSLLLGQPVAPEAGWQDSAGAALSGLLAPLLATPALLAWATLWAGAAVVAGALLATLRGQVSGGAARRQRRLLAPARPATAAAGRRGGLS
jgi:serine/threonine-protein kinase